MRNRDPSRAAFAAMLADYETHGRLHSEPYPGEVTPTEHRIVIVEALLLAMLAALGGIIAALAG